MIMQKEKKW